MPTEMTQAKAYEVRQLKNKVLCQCKAGHCFLEKDSVWSRQNFSESENGFQLDVALLNNLDTERLRQKDEWLDSLGVIGSLQVCCRRQIDR
ncbi:hypothetical protein [Methylobacter sp.]|uniref:hypothetical protein n=1 Tax=Methylobacter sp. TaxID=2051955 RepID=UPI002FDE1DEF